MDGVSTPGSAIPRAFINYRRDDAKEVARALHSELKRVLEHGEVFLDHQEIEPGASFPDTLKTEIAQATVVLVLIGPQWLKLQSLDGIRRLDEPDDWVRKEIELALELGTLLLPVLVDQAQPLTKNNFRTIPSIEALADLQTIPLTTRDWAAHFDSMLTFLEGLGFRRRETREAGHTPSVPSIFRSNVPARGRKPFVGRSNHLDEMARCLDGATPPQFLVLYGEPGVGKSELAREFARRRQGHYPGGTFVIDASTGGPPLDLASVGIRMLGLRPPTDQRIEDQCIAALLSLGSANSLVIYDNALTSEWVRAWLPPAGMPCHVIVTSQWSKWDDRWHTLRVLPLDDRESRELIEAVSGEHDLRDHVAGLVQESAGLPVQLLPAARSLLTAIGAGRSPVVQRVLTAEARSSFDGPWTRLGEEGRSFLIAATFLHTDRIDPELLREVLAQQLNWSDTTFDTAVNGCADLFLVAGDGPLQMHRLLARFVREKAGAWRPDLVAKLRQGLWGRLLDAADQVREELGSAERALRLLSFDLAVTSWSGSDRTGAIWGEEAERIASALGHTGQFGPARLWAEAAVSERQKSDADGRVDHENLSVSLHLVGDCLSQTGKYDEARPWYERAVVERQKGDVHGRVDHAELGSSLHQVGYCLSQTGKYDEARPWYERAVTEKERGDVEGRLDHASLGSSFQQVGSCLSETGKYDEARPWHERAVAEKEKGDVNGRVDHTSLGRSLQHVGYCFSRTGKYDEARPWHERAVTEKEKGDVHGRVDHESLGNGLHHVGYCFSQAGQYDEARRYYERAVAEAEKGDVHGRVDHDSLGSSLQEVGHCLSETGKYDEARRYYERAMAEAEKGDVHGRVDHNSLGSSLHQVGYCLSQTGKHDQALAWHERAVVEKQKGDVHGRVDRESLELSERALRDARERVAGKVVRA